VNGDLELSAGCRFDILGKLGEVDGMRIIDRIGGRQIPSRLRAGSGQSGGEKRGRGEGRSAAHLHL